jgi:hypothetical protein
LFFPEQETLQSHLPGCQEYVSDFERITNGADEIWRVP